MLLSLRIAIRYLFAKRKEKFISVITWLAIGGVALSVMVLIVVIAVMSGFHSELKEKILGVNAHINITDADGIIYDSNSLISKVLGCKYVVSAAPYVAGQIIVGAGNRITGVHLRGIDSYLELGVSNIEQYIIAGRLPEKGHEVVIGKEFARIYGTNIGDVVQIFSPTPIKDFSWKELKEAKAKITDASIVGIFDSGMYEYDMSLVYVPLDYAQELFSLDNGIHGLTLRLNDADLAYLAKQELQKQLHYPYIIKGWMDINKNVFSALQTEKRVMFILLILAVAVAGTNIVSTLIMMVMEKTKDIGILKSVGASGFSIGSIFIFLGSIIGILGTLIGSVCGIALVHKLNDIEAWIAQVFGYKLFPSDVYYFQKIPAELNFFDIYAIIICAIILSVFSAWYPAWKAARMNPVDAIKYE